MSEMRNKNITIAMTQTQYDELKKRAENDRRPLAQFVGLVVVDYLEGKQ